MTGCADERADEIYSRLAGAPIAQGQEDPLAAASDGLTDDQLPEGVEIALDVPAVTTSALTVYDAPSLVGGVIGSLPEGTAVRVTGVVRRSDAARWYDVTCGDGNGYILGGLTFAAEASPTPAEAIPTDATSDPTATPTEAITPEPAPSPSATDAPIPTPETTTQAPDVTPAPTETAEITPNPTEQPESTTTPDPTLPPETPFHAVVLAPEGGVQLYKSPSADDSAVARAEGGSELTVVSIVRMADGCAWYGVAWQGSTAYVRGDEITLVPDPTATPAASETPVADDTAQPSETPTATATPAPSETPVEEATAQSSETPMATTAPGASETSESPATTQPGETAEPIATA